MRGQADLASGWPFSLTHFRSIQSYIQLFANPRSHFLPLSFCLSPQMLKVGPEVKGFSHLTSCMQLCWKCSLVAFLISFRSASGPRALSHHIEGVWGPGWNDGWRWSGWQEGCVDTDGFGRARGGGTGGGQALFFQSVTVSWLALFCLSPFLRTPCHPFSFRKEFWAPFVWQLGH